MRISVVDSNKDSLTINIEETSYALMNSLRRSVMHHVPTLAIEEVSIVKNSGLFDEALAHRLGLLPWKADLSGIPESGVTFVLKKKGPCTVYAKDLVCPKGISSVYPDAIVTQLLKDQEIELEAVAQVGIGADHSKWQASVVGYKNLADVTIKGIAKDAVKNVSDWLSIEKNSINLNSNVDPAQYSRIEELSNGKVSIYEKPDAFTFTVESVSGQNPKDILIQGIEQIEKSLNAFEDQL